VAYLTHSRLRIPLAILAASVITGCPLMEEAPRGAPREDTMHLWIVFTRDQRPQPVLREIPRTEAVLRASLEQLVQGPTVEERADGITSWFSSETADILARVSIDPAGQVLVDFDDFRAIVPGASSSAGSDQLLWELNSTLFQFPSVQSVDYRIEGSCETFWHFLQRPCAILQRPAG
jgi:hypothetical protein